MNAPYRETKSRAPKPRCAAPLLGPYPLGRVRLRLGAQPVLLRSQLRGELRTEVLRFEDGADLDLARAGHRIRAALHPAVMRPRAVSPCCHGVSRWGIRVASTLQARVIDARCVQSVYFAKSPNY